MCVILLEHTETLFTEAQRNIFYSCISILSDAQTVHVGGISLWETDFCSYIDCFVIDLLCIHHNPFLTSPISYSYPGYNLLLEMHMCLSLRISLKCGYWLCLGWPPDEAGLGWLRCFQMVHNHWRTRLQERHQREAWWESHPLMLDN